MRTRFVSLALSAVVACGSSDDGPGSATPDAPTSHPADAPPATESCPTPTGPTVHTQTVHGAEVWTAAGSPHVVPSTLAISSGGAVVIEPCAVVKLGEGASLAVASGGTVTAAGTAEKPIRFESSTAARWGAVVVRSPSLVDLAYVTLTNGGAGDTPSDATIYGEGTGQQESTPILAVNHVRVESSLGVGVRLARTGAFVAGSTGLVVEGAGGAPLEVNEHALDSLPDGSYGENGEKEIVIHPEWALSIDTTMRDLGVRYRFGVDSVYQFVVGAGPGKPTTTLTIDPGVTIAFSAGTTLEIEQVSGEFPATGVVHAAGTAEKPIVFTSASGNPQAGDWRGLWFGGIARAENVISHARVEYTGADCLCVLTTCSTIEHYNGAFIFSQEPPSVFITDTEVTHGAGHAFVLGYRGSYLDFASANTMVDIAGCDAILPAENTCPSPRPACH